ncbi:methyl-accepting chemotaxis protein [Aquibacillus kalidii]|uniref:methyl-accepting chemotaxis protein n=1 Tax=Aquibacillus kalidii TaxID=2762597 RepID=UPI0016471550|nr:methyl-accepting chemotaxis protein [Aquibacillus kalidii]
MGLKINAMIGFAAVIILNCLSVLATLFMLPTENNIPLLTWVIPGVSILVSVGIAFFFIRKIGNQLQNLTIRVREVSSDDTSVMTESKVNFKEFVEIDQFITSYEARKTRMKTFLTSITEHIKNQSSDLQETTDRLESGSNQIVNTMGEISSGADQQADAASSLTEIMQDFTDTIMKVVMNGENIKEESKSMLSITEEGTRLMNQSVDKMQIIDTTIKESLEKVQGLDHMTVKITQLVTVIQEIAEQTNLLALNAAIEAARAGEQGRGFAVVADEVRKLAEQVSKSITDITSTANGIQSESKVAVKALEQGYVAVTEGSNQVATTGDTFNQLNKIIHNIGKEIETVSNSLYGVLDNTKTINDSITNIASVTQESAAGIEEVATTSEQLRNFVDEIRSGQDKLQETISQLKV